MELIAFLAFFLIEGFVFWCGYVTAWNRCCKAHEREARQKVKESRLSPRLEQRITETRNMSCAEILARARKERANPIEDVLAAKKRIDENLGYTFDSIPLRGPITASILTEDGPPQPIELIVHRFPDHTQLLFSPPATIKSGESICLSFAPVTIPAGR